MRCAYFDAGICRSCDLMGQPYPQQVEGKQRVAESLVAADSWMPPVAGIEEGFRAKAKMVVGGTVDSPTLGILDAQQRGADLRACGVIAPGITALFPAIAAFITRAAIEPYDVVARTGELKHVIVTEAAQGSAMLRLVLRSREAESRIRKHLPVLLEAEPRLAVVSINLQPEHKAVLEGATEIVLTPADTLAMQHGDVVLQVRPKSFIQTNTAIATALYRTGAAWISESAPRSVWDLYCGVGGFALHVQAPGRRVLGVEVSEEAIESARSHGVGEFLVGDATEFAERATERPDAVIVNPPRRGLGERLATWLERNGPDTVLYSSCNVVTLARDLVRMPGYRVVRAQVFDMFPQTSHFEVLTLLERR